MSDSKIELERTYTVPLSRAWIAPRYRRTSRAVNVLKEFARHHMKSSEIKIDSDLNEKLWKRGVTKPPRRIMVTMTKDEDGLVTISLPKLEEEATAEPEQPAQGENEEEPVLKTPASGQENKSNLAQTPQSEVNEATQKNESGDGKRSKGRGRRKNND
jgi:large subunit ribosomal protein L31e